MKQANEFAIVLVTAPDLKTARRLAKGALQARLVACANLVPRLESHYWWEGSIEKGSEVLIIFKTAQSKVAPLEQFVAKEHPYQVPEFLVLPLKAGGAKYLNWIRTSIKS